MLELIPRFTKKIEPLPVVKEYEPIQEQKSAVPVTLEQLLIHNGDQSLHSLFKFHPASTDQLIKAYQSIAPLYDAINTISNAVAGLPIALRDKKNKDKIIRDDPALDIFNTPNREEQKTKEALFFQMAVWKLLEGDIYLNATGNINQPPKELFIFKPQFMTIRISQLTGFPSEFEFSAGGSQGRVRFKKDELTGRIFEIQNSDTSELSHNKNFNPASTTSDPTGMSEAQVVLIEARSYLQAGIHNLSLLENGASPSGALAFRPKDATANQNLSDEQRVRLKDEITSAFQGSRNAGRPLILEGSMEWLQMGMSLTDMDFANLKQMVAGVIFKTFGIPEQMKEASSATFNNKAEARLEFYETRVIPFMQDILSELTTFLLVNRFKEDNLEYIVDIDNVDALILKRNARTKMITENPTLTLRRKLELQGEKSVAGDDIVFTAAGVGIAGDGLAADDETPIDEVQQDD